MKEEIGERARWMVNLKRTLTLKLVAFQDAG
jgi:hypothetical protein